MSDLIMTRYAKLEKCYADEITLKSYDIKFEKRHHKSTLNMINVSKDQYFSKNKKILTSIPIIINSDICSTLRLIRSFLISLFLL